MLGLKGTSLKSENCLKCLYASIQNKKFAGCNYLLFTGKLRPEDCFVEKGKQKVKMNPYGGVVIKDGE